jgi:hypothetical protein
MPSPTVDIMLIPPIYILGHCFGPHSVTSTYIHVLSNIKRHVPPSFKVSVASDSVAHESRTRDYGLGGFEFFPGEFHEIFAGGVSS